MLHDGRFFPGGRSRNIQDRNVMLGAISRREASLSQLCGYPLCRPRF